MRLEDEQTRKEERATRAQQEINNNAVQQVMLQALQGVPGIVQTYNDNTSAKESSDMTNDHQHSQIVPLSAVKENGSPRKQIRSDPTTETQIVVSKQLSVGLTKETETTSSYSANFNPPPGGQPRDAPRNKIGRRLE